MLKWRQWKTALPRFPSPLSPHDSLAEPKKSRREREVRSEITSLSFNAFLPPSLPKPRLGEGGGGSRGGNLLSSTTLSRVKREKGGS